MRNIQKSTKETQGNSPKKSHTELLNKKTELLVSLATNFKTLADAERASEEDLIMVSQNEVLHSSLNRVLHDQLRQVESALARLANGEYGACPNCGSLISPKRLQAVPWARYCVDCEDKAASGQLQEVLSIEGD